MSTNVIENVAINPDLLSRFDKIIVRKSTGPLPSPDKCELGECSLHKDFQLLFSYANAISVYAEFVSNHGLIRMFSEESLSQIMHHLNLYVDIQQVLPMKVGATSYERFAWDYLYLMFFPEVFQGVYGEMNKNGKKAKDDSPVFEPVHDRTLLFVYGIRLFEGLLRPIRKDEDIGEYKDNLLFAAGLFVSLLTVLAASDEKYDKELDCLKSEINREVPESLTEEQSLLGCCSSNGHVDKYPQREQIRAVTGTHREDFIYLMRIVDKKTYDMIMLMMTSLFTSMQEYVRSSRPSSDVQ